MCVCLHYLCPKCIVKMSSFGNAPVRKCRLWAGGLVCVCVHLCVFFLIIFALNALSICAVFRHCTCQDVSSFDSAPVKMCHLRAGGLVCVLFLCICALSALSRCLVFRQCTCQDVSSFGRGPCVCVCVFSIISALMHCQDVSSFGNAPVKMCRLWAGGLVCVCVSSPLFLP